MKLFTHPPEVYWRVFYRRRHRRLHRVPEEEQTCLNCGTAYHGNYCPVCGQSHCVKSLTLIHVLRNFWFSLITLRKGYAITLIELIGHPGFFMRHYIRGHRMPYVHPFRLLLVLLAIYVLLSLTFMPEQLPREEAFGFTPYLNSIQTDDWRQTIARYIILGVQYIHETPLLQMAAGRFKEWFFQNQALQALTLFPFFAFFSYTLFHSGISREDSTTSQEDGSEKKVTENKTPGVFETTVMEPLRPLWDISRIIRVRVRKWLDIGWAKFTEWWIKNFGRPVVLIKAIRLLKRLGYQCAAWWKRGLQEIKPKKTTRIAYTYDFIEVIYMRGYFTCLLMIANIVLFFWGVSITPYNIWVMAGTVWIYRNFFNWYWWDTIRRTLCLYLLTFFFSGIYCLFASIMDVVKE